MIPARAYAAFDPRKPLAPHTVQRREPGEHDVLIDVLHCGVCHSDLHQARDEWGGASYPMVPGHEIVGRVARVGAKVTRFRAGDVAGVGCFVDSCRACGPCGRGEEQYCEQHTAFTYNSTEMDLRTPTQGGYSARLVVDERYVLRVAPAIPSDRAAPLLCAGITVFAPMQHWGVARGHRLAVLGLGGLGHLAVKIAASLGAEVTLLSGSPGKRADAARLGAHDFVLTSDREALKRARGRFDFILDTVAAPHPIGDYLELLRLDGKLLLVGAPDRPLELPVFPLLLRRRTVSGSLIGGIAQTQAMLDHCAAHNITADVETLPVSRVNEAYERLARGDVRYRFVLDVAELRD